ncbi:MAG: 2-hydroxyacyl-CoA dehydratase [Deltaproteobacteria bacterium]|jgi:benzoyl-CoA reductase/2-hydroxyglutaryl-CoA dehydratase subunit BcrC/BadD/HgdB|nr:MAG: 2-hydroxyacyl-CoA dehydratase [Deltaproteobacteria bacterium]
MSDYNEMWKGLGLDIEKHDVLLNALGAIYSDVYMNQECRPNGMGYFDFVMSEVHGLRIKELLEHKEKGGKVVGTFCLYVPDEIILAAGGLSVGLCGGAQFSVPDADAVLPRNLCPLIKSAFGFKISKICPYFEVADFVIGETTCDGKKKVWELLNEHIPTYVMELPQMKRETDRDLWLKEVKAFMEKMEEESGVKITPEVMEEKIKLVNRKREAIQRVFDARKANPVPISGKDALLISQIAFYDDLERFTTKVNELADELEERNKKREGVFDEKRPRILVSGCPMAIPNWKLHSVIEDSGGVVVCEESCVGTRYFSHLVEEERPTVEDKVKAIAERYMRINCSCFSPNEERIDDIIRYVKDYNASGVIHYTLQFCHTYNVEFVRVKEALKKANIPVLEIETDYSEGDVGQLKTRVEAFIEQVL